MATKWEYKTILGGGKDGLRGLDAQLQEAGQDGWEAVGVTPGIETHFGGLLPYLNQAESFLSSFVVLLKRPIG